MLSHCSSGKTRGAREGARRVASILPLPTAPLRRFPPRRRSAAAREPRAGLFGTSTDSSGAPAGSGKEAPSLSERLCLGGLRERRKVAPFPAASPGAAELASPGRTEQFPPLPSGAFAAAKPRYPGDHGEQNNTPPRPSRSRRTSLVICSVSLCSRDHRRIYNCDLSPRRRSWMNSLPAGQRITSRLLIIIMF